MGEETKDSWSKTQILLPLVIALVGGIFTYSQHQSDVNRLKQDKVESESRLAQQEKNEVEKLKADRAITLLKHLSSDNERERFLALKFCGHLISKEQFPLEMLEVLEQIRTDDKNPENQKAARDSLVKGAQTTVKTAQQNIAIQRAAANVAPEIINNLPARIYLQFQREMPRDQAEEIEKMLEAKGWNVPGIEAVNQVPSQNELRYFAGGNNTDADVQNIVQILKGLNIEVKTVDLSKNYPNSKTRPRHYEIWLSKNS